VQYDKINGIKETFYARLKLVTLSLLRSADTEFHIEYRTSVISICVNPQPPKKDIEFIYIMSHKWLTF